MIETIDPQILGERLRLARSNAGTTQEDAARTLSVSRPTLIAIEQGQRKIRPEELLKLSAAYCVSVNDLLRPSAIHVDLVAKFRRRGEPKERRPDSEEAVWLLNRLASAAVELETRLGRRQQVAVPPEVAILPGDLERQAEDLALDLRHRLGLGLAPITDIVLLVELELGVRIFFRPLASEISGVIAYDQSVGPCMLVNSLHPRERQLVTIVHELGHFLCARETPDVLRDNAVNSSREEKFVTLFAVAFLIPAAAVRRRFREFGLTGGTFTLRNLVLIAHTFGVSFEAMTRRMEALKLLKHGTFDSLKERGFAIEEARRNLGLASAPLFSSPPRLTLLAIEAHKRGLLSEGQLSNMLVLDRVQLREQLDSFGGSELDDAIAIET
jgi:Zn-dependent peptidase ImmA (M78 family)/DNA-binding XRE family transcriptional regulator